jgi:hypothetical protein
VHDLEGDDVAPIERLARAKVSGTHRITFRAMPPTEPLVGTSATTGFTTSERYST